MCGCVWWWGGGGGCGLCLAVSAGVPRTPEAGSRGPAVVALGPLVRVLPGVRVRDARDDATRLCQILNTSRQSAHVAILPSALVVDTAASAAAAFEAAAAAEATTVLLAIIRE